ncbi:hypothetical protein CANARDRAFT_199814 [[Candida] arabinofermentans NRRL YB-2248]|uniref:Methyltransferase domain-containing protein n=1 Tax=[Candida] arabinofermentans NRRL YB-2248 TaxID=983967 RepID=A0A1E4SZS0_9ASCO|nr:hypothetical protein CANARDRAFT_199814 [[Candida] arabinofermentans NRRL YB-2248]
MGLTRPVSLVNPNLVRGGSGSGSGSFSLSLVRFKVQYQVKPDFKYKTKKIKTPEQIKAEEDEKKYQEAINSDSWFRKWGAITASFEFNRKATKYYIGLYIIFIGYGIHYFQKLYNRDVEKKDLLNKRDLILSQGGTLTEWERLRLRELGGDLIRTTDVEKLKAYLKLRDEWQAKVDACETEEEKKALGEFNPSPQDIEPLVDHSHEHSVLPPKDLTEFYDNIAEDYDSQISSEELFSLMSRKRKWVMKHCKGDVLEVASGTGRNIPYMNPSNVSSYTFLDTSTKMMEVTYEKFKQTWPEFSKVKFVVGKAEDLLNLTGGNKIKYDTIVETFGLCSHQDPVKALENMKGLLKPGGRIVLLEHGRGTFDFINSKLDSRAEKHSESWGCRWNLDIGELVDESGLEITEEKRSHFGTTWCIVAKMPGDVIEIEELGFFDKYFTTRKTNFDTSASPVEKALREKARNQKQQ